MTSTNWKQVIVDLVLLKQKLAEVDTEGLWEYHLPAVAATEAELAVVEAHIGESLDPSHRAFLLHADGWPAVHQTVDLFGSADLRGGPRFVHATKMLGYIDDEVLEAGDLRRADLLPIAASPVDLNVFVITRRSAATPGVVVWFAGAEIDRFPTFDEYMLATLDYNRLEIQALQGSA
ncbi:MAG: SMI1/KNR4 family protein [Actinomycetota bacterium]|nr:SMI1/KNR4 family protein [Actinomycetota bacterium]